MAGQDNPQTPPPQSNNQKLVIGLIVGILIGLFIAFYLLDYFPVVSTALINVLIALFLVGVFAVLAFTWFKDRILAQLFGTDFQVENSKEELKNLYGQIGQQYVSKLLEGFPKETRQTAKLATPRLLKLAIWAFTRSWALRLIVAIFVAIGGLLGAILLYNQNQLLNGQNELLLSQNDKLDTQNLRLNLQNNLIEADRRSSLVFLMSNVLDRVDAEIALQRQSRVEKSDTVRYRLSKPLISRIVALSRAFRPYRMFQGDTLSEKLVSPERGQLFVSLMENNLDSFTQNTIVRSGDFSNAIIGKIQLDNSNLSYANLRGADLRGAKLQYSDLRRADLRGADLRHPDFIAPDFSGTELRDANLSGANLSGANLTSAYFRGANLSGVNLSNANLHGVFLLDANLSNANLSGVLSLTPKQLQQVQSLHGCRNLDPKLEERLRAEKLCLFSQEGCKE